MRMIVHQQYLHVIGGKCLILP